MWGLTDKSRALEVRGTVDIPIPSSQPDPTVRVKKLAREIGWFAFCSMSGVGGVALAGGDPLKALGIIVTGYAVGRGGIELGHRYGGRVAEGLRTKFTHTVRPSQDISNVPQIIDVPFEVRTSDSPDH
jgi:hypothetical protein